jgi:hypothetical protein
MELLQNRWNTVSSTIPGVPSFDSALGQMGGLGTSIIEVRNARSEILGNAADFDAMRNALVPGGLQGGENSGTTPWSIATSTVYERLLTQGAFGSIGLLEIHVTGSGKQTVPVTGNIGYAPACRECQPLTMHPLQGAAPQPALNEHAGVF